jgi:enterochelin esterase-like enzyme
MHRCLLLALFLGFTVSLAAQTAPVPDPGRTAPSRPVPAPRDPHRPGFVPARDLPDGQLPAPTADGNLLIGPTHEPAVEATEHEGVPKGTIVEFTMSSTDSKLYPGIAREAGTWGTPDPADPTRMVVTTSHPAPYTRLVAVYVPAGYKPGTVLPVIIGADGPDRLLFTVLDNLIVEKKIPPMAAVSIANGSGDAQGSERGLEYDTMSGRYSDFVETEVLPLAEEKSGIKLTHDPDGRATMGTSSGGAASLIMAWFHPERYHRVLAYSGTWINQQWPYNDAYPHGAWGFHETLISAADRKPIRIWMEVGDRDLLNPNWMRDNMHDWVEASERLARVLAAKGYNYQFVFAQNAVHGDQPVKQQTLAEALVYLWQGYKQR